MQDLKRYLDIRKERYPGAVDSPFCFITDYKGIRPLSSRAVQKLVHKYTGAFSSDKGISPHKLRHSFAADYIRKGGELILLKGQMGHRNIETTTLYTNLSSKENQVILDRMDESRRSQSDIHKETE